MQDRNSDSTFEGSARPLLVGLLAVQIFIGYEWLMSGLSKVLAGDFVSSLSGTLSDQSKDMTGWYKSFLDGVVIPNGQVFGYLVMFGELTLGVVLIGASLIWLTRWSHLKLRGRTTILVLITLAGVFAIFMNVNFHLASGANHPWIIAADPNGEGVDLDSVMPVIQLIISAVAFTFLRRVRAARPATSAQPVAAPSAARP
jgi:thiosulfate dehydrogenase (quinone) large subunit